MNDQDFEIYETGKCPLCLGKYRISTSSSKPPPNPKITKTWQSCNRPVSVRYTFSTGKSKYWSAQQNYHLNKHCVRACIRSQLRVLQVSATWFYYIFKISPNFKTCSNLEQATHHTPLQCHHFVLHGLAYLLKYLKNLTLHTTNTQWRPLVLHKVEATYFSCITHISSALCVSRGQPQIV